MLLAFLQRPHAWVVPALERLLLVLVLVRKWQDAGVPRRDANSKRLNRVPRSAKAGV